MTNAVAIPFAMNGNERKARRIAWIVTVIVTIALLLVMILVKLVTPIPAIPPDPEVMTVEVGLVDGSGGDAAVQGGGSSGNTGIPGSQDADASAHDVKNPADNGSVTDNSSDNPPAANTTHTSNNNQPTASNDLLAALNNWKKNKGAASINIGGNGSGDPYTGGLGNGSGSDIGPNNGGDPGTGTPGGHQGTDPSGDGHRYRHIVSKPDIVNPTQEEGKVVVNVYVDRNGAVKKAEVNPNGTTTLNAVLRSTATQSAYQIKFDADPLGPELLVIPIDIYFTLK
ncbi:MAG TPA: hypothetical protein VFU15_05600 [Bacteroidia bacterium]|nr:hypothetical protein [Bacteroidia bacterium]